MNLEDPLVYQLATTPLVNTGKILVFQFGEKKGIFWDFYGILVGFPKIGKMLPKPTLGKNNPKETPKLVYFEDNYIPLSGFRWDN